MWEEPEMRLAWARRDITRVYRTLQRYGYAQQRIAALTGQSQPEVSSIIHGRKVMAYDLIERIAVGLGVPRGYAGLSYCGQDTAHDHAAVAAAPDRPVTGGARYAVVGLDTAGEFWEDIPEIVQVAVLVLDGLVITRPPALWRARPSRAAAASTPRSARPFLSPARTWDAVADEVTAELSDRTLVMHESDQMAVLRWHLPAYPPPDEAICTRELAETVWPDLPDYDLGPLAAHARLDAATRLPAGAATQAHTTALLLLALLHDAAEHATDPPGEPAGE